jgi:hypothetical protein
VKFGRAAVGALGFEGVARRRGVSYADGLNPDPRKMTAAWPQGKFVVSAIPLWGVVPLQYDPYDVQLGGHPVRDG